MNCTFLAPGPRFLKFLPALLQTAAWFFSCPSQGDRWNLRGFLFRRLRIQSCYDVWALKMPHSREAEFLHLRLSHIEHVFFSIFMALIFVMCASRLFPGISTEDGSWLCQKLDSLSVLKVCLPACSPAPFSGQPCSPQPFHGILLPPSSGL